MHGEIPIEQRRYRAIGLLRTRRAGELAGFAIDEKCGQFLGELAAFQSGRIV
jgi:hypothetical protein